MSGANTCNVVFNGLNGLHKKQNNGDYVHRHNHNAITNGIWAIFCLNLTLIIGINFWDIMQIQYFDQIDVIKLIQLWHVR